MNLVQSRHRPAARGITGPSEAVVDLSAVRDNVRTFRKRVPQDVLAVVKADAFGHGAVPVRGIRSHLSHGDSADAVQSKRQLQLLRTGVGLAHRAGLYGIDELGIGTALEGNR